MACVLGRSRNGGVVLGCIHGFGTIYMKLW